jgi:ankyrin repeat protein
MLVDAGVPLDATDENGFTPLLYAATIDLGNTGVLQALRAAGADPRIRNSEGRTAWQQARYYGLARLEAGLRKYAGPIR